MKTIRVIGLALFALLALFAVFATAAFAETPEWLVGGVKVTEELAEESSGELTMGDSLTIAGIISVRCSWIKLGAIANGGSSILDSITAIDKLNGIGENNLLFCLSLKIGACAPETVDVTFLNLPWTSELLVVGGLIRDMILGLAFDILCLTSLGLEFEDKCEGETSAAMENTAEGDLEKFNGESEKFKCSEGGEEGGFWEGEDLDTTSGGLMAVS
jgi:hypothetical protein